MFAILDDPMKIIVLAFLGTAAAVSGMITGYQGSWVIGINPTIGSILGLFAALAGFLYWLTD